MDISTVTPQTFQENEAGYLSQLEDSKIWDSIPFLNSNDLHNFKDLSLVRFRGMVQDMHGPEMYLKQYEIVNEQTKEVQVKNGKFLDIADCQPNERVNSESPNTKYGERPSYAVISTPGLNDWVIQMEKKRFELPRTSKVVSHQKRPLEDDSMQYEQIPTSVESKKPCTNNPQSSQTPVGVSPEHLLNCPIPDDNAKVCHVKMYNEHPELKLNTFCDFVAFLSVNPALAVTKVEGDDVESVDFQVHNPPPSLIPRLHCVSYKILSHNNPLIAVTNKIDPDRMVFVNKELMIVLTQLLCGDALAAEMLIYHLISHVYIRTDLMAIGKLSLNISNVPQFDNEMDFVKEIYKFIQLMVTKSYYFSMSLESLNETAFVPKKDYNEDRLTSSVLQLSPNTHLILDETKLMPGKLNEAGVNAVKALSHVIKNQQLAYNFTYFEMEFDCDIPFLVFSQGKSLLPSDYHVKLQPDEMHLKTYQEIVEAARHFLNPELLDEIRVYLTQARLAEYELGDKTEMIENEYVKLRQKANVTGDDLHQLLVLARLVAVSQGKNSLDEDDWKKACALDDALKDRLGRR